MGETAWIFSLSHRDDVDCGLSIAATVQSQKYWVYREISLYLENGAHLVDNSKQWGSSHFDNFVFAL